MTADTSVAAHAARLAGRAREVALCLDFDGTLSPIVEDPQAARPLHGIVELLEPLANRFAAVALVSGRPAAYLAEHAAAPGVRYLGLYGLQEIRDGRVWVDPRLEVATPAGSPTRTTGRRRLTRPLARLPTGTGSRSSQASWSGSSAQPCAATRATRSAGSSPSRAPGRWSWSATTSAT